VAFRAAALKDFASIRVRTKGASMSVAEPCVSQPTRSRITRREKLWGWLMLAILLGILGVPLYAVYSVS